MALPHDLRDRELRSFVEVPPAPQGQPDNPTARQVLLVDAQGQPLAQVNGALLVEQGPANTGLGAWPVYLVDAAGNRLNAGTAATATLADATANPTVPGQAVFPFVFNGTTWDRARDASADTTTGAFKVALVSNTGIRLGSLSDNSVDGGSGTRGLLVGQAIFNGTNYDRQRGNEDRGAVITQIAATTGAATADLANYNARGIIVCINITAGTGLAITCLIKGKDAGTGQYQTLLTSTSLATTGAVFMTVYPGGTTTANVAANSPLPRTFQVSTTHGNATAATYTVGVNLIV